MKNLQPAFFLAVGLSVAACGSNEIHCEPLKSTCDIRKSSCQREIFRATACERDQRYAKMPKVRVITRAQLKQEEDANTANAKPSTQDKAWERAAKLLGFLPKNETTNMASSDMFVSDVAAFYSSTTKDITVISDAAENNDDGSFTLSHEFVHALQDQRDHFDKLYSEHFDSTDSGIALDSLFEGEAVLLSNFVLLRGEGHEPKDQNLDKYFSDMLNNILGEIGKSDSPMITASDLLPYPVGGQGLATIYKSDGLHGIEALYQDPYTTLSRWRVKDPNLPEELDCSVPTAPANHKLVLSDRLGSGGLLALDVALGTGTDLFASEPARWASDALAVFNSGGDAITNVAFAWRIRLFSESEAQALEQAAQSMSSASLTVARQGQEVLIAASEDAATLASWKALGECQKPAQPKSAMRQALLTASMLRRRQDRKF